MSYKKYNALNIVSNVIALLITVFFAIEKDAEKIIGFSPQLRIICGIVLFTFSIALLIFTIRARTLYRKKSDSTIKMQLDRLLFNSFKPMHVSILLVLNGVFTEINSSGICFYFSLIMFMIGIIIEGSSKHK